MVIKLRIIFNQSYHFDDISVAVCNNGQHRLHGSFSLLHVHRPTSLHPSLFIALAFLIFCTAISHHSNLINGISKRWPIDCWSTLLYGSPELVPSRTLTLRYSQWERYCYPAFVFLCDDLDVFNKIMPKTIFRREGVGETVSWGCGLE